MTTTQTRLTIIRYGAYFAIVIVALSLAYCGGGVGAAVTSLTAEPPALTGSGVSTLKWTSTDAKLCNLNGIPVGSNDSYTTPELTSTTTYTLTCLGTDGDYVTENITITVSSAAPTAESTAPATEPTTSTAEPTTPTTEPTTPTTTIPITTTPPTTTTPITTTPTTTTTAPTTTTGTTTTATTSTYASVAAACAAAPRLSGTVRYYCDCGTGAQSGCVAGNDANAGTDPLLPRRTIGNAATFLRSSAAVNDTVALCKGGAFNSAGSLRIGSTRCTSGTCNDLREYTPTTFAGTAKPIINNAAGTVPLILIDGNYGGLRLLNIKLNGDHGAKGNRNRGIFFYQGAHDVTMCNLDMDGFDVSVYNESDAGINNNIKLTGSRITNSRAQGYLGSGNNAEISYNHWDGNGGSTVFDHTIYISSHRPVSNVKVVGNYIHGQWGPTCLGNPINVQGQFDGLAVDGNEVSIERSAVSGGCWGISLADGGYSIPVYFRHASVSGNIVRNGGNQALSVQSCPGCLIENNLIIQDWVYGSGAWALAGIVIPVKFRSGDDENTANIIRNNTVYFGPSATGGGTGITVKTQGTNHVIANNTVYYSATSAGQGVNCFAYPLALSSYAFINNNHCYSAAPYSWVATRGTLAAWRTYATSGFDSASVTGNTLFTAVGTNFTPTAGSILIGRGDAAHGATRDITGKARPSPPAIGAYER